MFKGTFKLLLLSLTLNLSTIFGDPSEKVWDASKGCWPFNIVPYMIGKGFTEEQRQQILHQIAQIHSKSCVRWVDLPEHKLNNTDYLLFSKNKGEDPNYSCYFEGRSGPFGTFTAVISLSDVCFLQGSVTHEMLHVLGFGHEHQRTDRDCYVRVFEDKGSPLEPWYAISPQEEWLERFPYDKKSVMHYKRSNRMIALTERLYKLEPLGNLEGKLTDFDIWKIRYKFCNAPHYCDFVPFVCAILEKAEESCRKPRTPTDDKKGSEGLPKPVETDKIH